MTALGIAVLVLSATAAWAIGELAQKPGAAGCIAGPGGDGSCEPGAALDAAVGVATSPDGASVYVVSSVAGAVSVFDRAPLTGVLTQKAGTAGCISRDGSAEACKEGTMLSGAEGLAVSPNGENVYVASAVSGGVAIFDRDPETGELSQMSGTDGCIAEQGGGDACQDGRALAGAARVVASPDGTSVYVASPSIDAVAVLRRDPLTGALSQNLDVTGCISEDGTDGSGGICRNGRALDEPGGLAVSPNGENVYVASFGSGAVAVLGRGPAMGELTQKADPSGCVSDTDIGGACADGRALAGAFDVAASPDGAGVYVASAGSDAVAVFGRDLVSGALTQKTGTDGCTSASGGDGCRQGRALDGAFGLTTTADGESVYVTSLLADAVAVFDRDPLTGVLTQKPATAGCIAEDGSREACGDGIALDGAFGVAASPEGENVYVASFKSDAVAVFDRAIPPPLPGPTPSPSPAGTPSQPPADRLAPTVSGFGLTPNRFTATRKPASRFRFTLSEPAAVRIAVEPAGPGRPGPAACKPKSDSRPRCTGYARAGALYYPDCSPAANTVAFNAWIAKRPLRPGRYGAVITATDPAGNPSAPRRAVFTVVPSRR